MLVGRDAALDAIDAALASALRGHGRLVLVSGEAGIGKTTLARAMADRATEAGAVLRWGACWEGQSLLALAPWLDALCHPGGDACAAVATTVGEAVDGGDPPADGVTDRATDRARVRLFRSVVDAVRADAALRPQVLVLEDLHWADAHSLDLLHALAPHLPAMAVLVLATYRDDELPAERLAGIGGGAERVALEGLVERDVASVLADVVGRPLLEGEARAVHEQTGGNPLFVTQVGRLIAAGSRGTVPTGARDVIARRLARVSPSCHDVLGAASVLGTAFEAPVVATVLGRPEADVLADLDEAAGVRLVHREGDHPNRWSFAHALVRDTRYGALGSSRGSLHRRAVEAMANAGAPAGVLAHHAHHADFPAGDPRPSVLALAAAEEALARLAVPESAVLAERALAAAPPGPSGDETRAQAWLVLGTAHLRSGQHERAAEAFQAAARLGRTCQRFDVLARAALGFGAGLGGFEVPLFDPRQIHLLEDAAGLTADDSPLRPLLLARLSVALSFVGSEERRLELADEAVAAARRLGDEPALAAALAARSDAIAGPAHVEERLVMSSEVVDIGRRIGDPRLELLGRRLRAVALLEAQDRPAFEAEVAAFAATAERLDDPFYGWYVPMWQAMRCHAEGRLDEALALSARSVETGAAAGSTNAVALGAALRSWVFWARRDVVGMESMWDDMMAHSDGLPEAGLLPSRALIDVCAGRTEAAAAVLRHPRLKVSQLPVDQELLATLAQLATVAAGCRAVDTAREVYDALLPFAGVGVFEGHAAADNGVVDRFLAVCAGVLGDGAAVRAHIPKARAAVAGAGRLLQALTDADCGRALVQAGDPADRPWAEELLDGARRVLLDVGLDAMAAELDGLLAGAGAVPERGAAQGARLVREGDAWAWTFAGTTVRVRHGKGMADLAVLLARAGCEVHVRELEGVVGRAAVAGSPAAAAGLGPALDGEAVAAYRRRLQDLEEELDEADRHADVARAEKLAAERDALVAELSGAFGLGGRRRAAGSDPDERLRKAVSARVKATIGRLEELHPALGRHLAHSVRTGFWCAYEPEHPVLWTVETAAT